MAYLMEKWPTGNSNPNVYYVLTIRKNGKLERRHYYTVDDVETAVQQLRINNIEIVTARRFCKGSWSDFVPETAAEKSRRENENHCEYIGLEMEMYAAGEVYRCPDCGETLHPIDTGDKYKCPSCGAVNDVDDLEQLGLWDYFEDVLDVEYRVSGCQRNQLEYRSVRLLVAFGGPNIYIDTAARKVQLYWWTEYAEYELSRELCDEIDAHWEKIYLCC